MLPITAGFHDTLRAGSAAAGAESRSHVVAPNKSVSGNNAQAYASTEMDMVGNMQELRIDAVERNAEFTAHLNSIKLQRDAAWAIVERTRAERRAQDAALRESVETSLTAAFAELTALLNSTFDSHVASLAPIQSQLDACASAERSFYSSELPSLHNRQVAAAVKRMEQDREDMRLEVAASEVGQVRLLHRVHKFETASDERAAVEADDRARQAASLQRQLAAAYGPLAPPPSAEESSASASTAVPDNGAHTLGSITHSAQRLEKVVPAEFEAIRASLGKEEAARQAGDTELAGTAAEALTRVKEAALRYFGAASGGGDSSDRDE